MCNLLPFQNRPLALIPSVAAKPQQALFRAHQMTPVT